MESKQNFVGMDIKTTIASLINEADETGQIIEYEFNGVTLNVAGDSSLELIYREWDRGMLREGYVVNPYPSELTAEQIAEDQQLKDERKARQKASQDAYNKRMDDKRAAFKSEIDGIEIALSDKEGWDLFVSNNSDPYGAACVRFAENWACLMQSRMAETERPLGEIADTASHDADTEGITGFMYGAAVSMLSQCWEHGEELRKWHNIETQIGNEGEKANASGGVLNPALLSVG